MQRDPAIIAAAAGLLIWLLAQVLGGAAGSDTPLGVDRVEPTSAEGPSQRVTLQPGRWSKRRGRDLAYSKGRHVSAAHKR